MREYYYKFITIIKTKVNSGGNDNFDRDGGKNESYN